MCAISEAPFAPFKTHLLGRNLKLLDAKRSLRNFKYGWMDWLPSSREDVNYFMRLLRSGCHGNGTLANEPKVAQRGRTLKKSRGRRCLKPPPGSMAFVLRRHDRTWAMADANARRRPMNSRKIKVAPTSPTSMMLTHIYIICIWINSKCLRIFVVLT